MERTMSNTPDMSSFGKFVPGFDFLQNLAKQAAGGAAQSIPQLPNLSNWVAPTLNVEELDKRIDELKAVQFWLDQNAMALKATIQALEVQKMTVATLKGMNFNFGDVANAFKLKAADSMMSGMQKVTEKASDDAATVGSFAGTVTPKKKPAAKKAAPAAAKSAAPSMATGMVDPMQLWGALTKQFGEIAAGAMKDAAKQTAIDVTKGVATDMAKGAFKKATDMAGNVANTMTGGMAGAVGKAMTSATSAAKKPANKVATKKRSR
jgi:predicted XRE-type DNA-binding protein